MTKDELKQTKSKHAAYMAKVYRGLAENLISAANVLDHAGELHNAFPIVTLSNMNEAIEVGFIMNHLNGLRAK